MLDEPSQCTLVASHGCTVDDPRQNLLTLLINVVHTELLCTCAVKLDGYHRIFLTIYVLRLDINLRSVECGLSVSLCERNVILIHNVTQILLGAVPILVIAKVFLLVIRIPLRQTVSNISVDTKCLHYIVTQLGTSCQFFLSLIRTKNDMCLCDCELSYTGKSMHLTGILVTEQSGCLCHTIRKVSVRMLLIHIYIILERTSHWTKCHRLLVIRIFI